MRSGIIGKGIKKLKKFPVANPYIINNSFIFLSACFCGYEESVSKVLLELLRQPKDFLEFNNISVDKDIMHAQIATSSFICYI